MLEAVRSGLFYLKCPESLECDNFSTKLDNSQTLFVYFRNQSSKGWLNNYFKPTVTDIIKFSFISFKTVNSPLLVHSPGII